MTKTTDTAYKDAVYYAIELANARGRFDGLATVRAFKDGAIAFAGDDVECVVVEFKNDALTPTHRIVWSVTPDMFPYTEACGGYRQDGAWRGSDVLACREVDGPVGPILDFV